MGMQLRRTNGARNPWEISHHSDWSGRGLKSFHAASVGDILRRNSVNVVRFLGPGPSTLSFMRLGNPLVHQAVRHDDGRAPTRFEHRVHHSTGDTRLPGADFVGEHDAALLNASRDPHKRCALAGIETLGFRRPRRVLRDEPP